MEYKFDIVIKEEKLSEDEETQFEDEEKLFLDAPIKIEYDEDNNYGRMDTDLEISPGRCMIPDMRKRLSDTLTAEIPVKEKQKCLDRIKNEKIVENKHDLSKTDFRSQLPCCRNMQICSSYEFFKGTAKPVDVACQTEILAKRAETEPQTEVLAGSIETGCQTENLVGKVTYLEEYLTEAINFSGTGLPQSARRDIFNGAMDSAECVSSTDLEGYNKNVTNAHPEDVNRIPPQNLLIKSEICSPTQDTTKDVAITLSLALCKGFIQNLKPRTVPRSILCSLSREVVTSVRDALSKIHSKPVTENETESKFVPVIKSGTIPSQDSMDEEPFERKPESLSEPSKGLKEDPEYFEDVAYSDSFCNGKGHFYCCWNCAASFPTKKMLRKHFQFFCTKGLESTADDSRLEELEYLYWCGICGIYHKCYQYPHLSSRLP